jgi:tetratricopeptide (TPR) repeat protein
MFRASPQLVAFLSYIVEATLEGKSDRLKGYVVGTEALGRGADFDPRIDPIVRVEATRLRRALDTYYAGPGQNDDVLIEVPSGGNVPAFSRRIVEAPRTAPDDAGPAPWWRLPGMAAALVIIALAAAALAWRTNRVGDSAVAPGDLAHVTAADLRPGNGMPTLFVRPFEVIGTPDQQAVAEASLRSKLIDAFARFDAINVLSEPPPNRPADFVLNGMIDYNGDGTATVLFRLRDTDAGDVIWSRAFERIGAGEERGATEDKIAFALSPALMEPFGVIYSREQAKSLTGAGGDPRYRCLLLAMDAIRSFDPAEHEAMRACLERLTEIDRSFASGFTYLAFALDVEYVYGFGRDAADPRALDAALPLARRGIELAPASARAYQALSVVLFGRGQTAEAITAMERAVALNKYDLIVQGGLGGRLVTTGETERGMKLLAQSGDYGTVQPPWVHFYLFLGNYLAANYAEARYQADQMTSDYYSHGLVARALAAYRNDDQGKAQQALRRLVALRPAWRDDPRGELAREFPSRDILDRLVADLDAAGLRSVEAER